MAARVAPRLGQPLTQWWAKVSRFVTKSKYLVWVTNLHDRGEHSVPFRCTSACNIGGGRRPD